MPPNLLSQSADRNLLFGIVALQMDFISSDQPIAAMQAWAFDKQKSLGQVLCEQGALVRGSRGDRAHGAAASTAS